MPNINLQKFTDDLITDFRDRTQELDLGEKDIPVAIALLTSITVAATKLLDGTSGDGRQLQLPLTRGQKAARTRKRNAAKAAKVNGKDTSAEAGAAS